MSVRHLHETSPIDGRSVLSVLRKPITLSALSDCDLDGKLLTANGLIDFRNSSGLILLRER